ncbi:MAG: AAA family ATPase [Rhodospirillaceae bacterium]|nr:AAA family ATPase [Rhodospirillales bacterium]
MNSNLAPTGIDGLDDILRGGLPRGRIYLIRGEPGTGKTTLALQFLRQGAKDGERGLYFAQSESVDEIEGTAASHDWDLSGIDIFSLDSAQQLVSRENQNSVFRTATVELTETESLLYQRIKASSPDRVVIDSMSEFRLLAAEPWVYRLQLLRLKTFFASQGVTALLLDSSEGFASEPENLVHGVISLTYEISDFGHSRRKLSVRKMRQTAFMEGNHDIDIRSDGLWVFPRLIAAEMGHSATLSPVLPSGVKGLDELVGGGLDAGSTILIIGPAGVGKSTISMQFGIHAAEQGMKVQAFVFEEREDIMLQRWASLGYDLRPHLERKTISMRHLDPAELSAGEFARQVRIAVEEEGAKLLIIDSLTGYQQAMSDERTLMLQLHELQTYLGNHGVTTIIVDTQHGVFTASSAAAPNISYLADTVLLLRYYEFRGAIRKAVSALKRRAGRHETTIRDYEMGPTGLTVGRALTEFSGVLSGSPVYLSTDSPFRDGKQP